MIAGSSFGYRNIIDVTGMKILHSVQERRSGLVYLAGVTLEMCAEKVFVHGAGQVLDDRGRNSFALLPRMPIFQYVLDIFRSSIQYLLEIT